MTSAQGADVYVYTWKHAASYAVTHVAEWEPPTWDMLDPARNVHLPLYGALWLASLAGVARGRRVSGRALALGLFGLLLVVRGRRNLGLGAELLVPFASDGLDALFAGTSPRIGRATTFASLAFSVVVFARLAGILDIEVGPLGTLESADALFPVRGAAFLRGMPAGTRVLTTYDAGAPLAYWLDGHVRTSLDARTVLYFDDAEYAAARASWEDAGALDRTLRMYALEAAVVDRANPVCAMLAARADWEPVVVEANQTTFVRKEVYRGAGAGHLAPCGDDRFTTDACDDGGAALQRELDALAGDPFIDDMRVEARIQCGHGALDADALVAMLPLARARRASWPSVTVCSPGSSPTRGGSTRRSGSSLPTLPKETCTPRRASRPCSPSVATRVSCRCSASSSRSMMTRAPLGCSRSSRTAARAKGSSNARRPTASSRRRRGRGTRRPPVRRLDEARRQGDARRSDALARSAPP